MSDSDDTDILLLIPPNYYLKDAEKRLMCEEKALQRRQFNSLQHLESLEYIRRLSKKKLTDSFEDMDGEVFQNDGALTTPLPSTTYKIPTHNFLPPSRKAELNFINDRLHNIERDDIVYIDNMSDISSISTNTVRTQPGRNNANRELVGIIHSTPKCTSSSLEEQPQIKNVLDFDKDVCSDISTISTNPLQFDNNKANKYIGSSIFKAQSPTKKTINYDKGKIVSEIDNLLLSDGIVNNEGYLLQQQQDNGLFEQQLQKNTNLDENHFARTGISITAMQNNAMQTLPSEKTQVSNCLQTSKADNDLISLSEIWGKSGQATTIAATSQKNLKEEQLRRQHLEKTIRQLQIRLLEYQQRLSVAIEVDRAKDNALNNAHMENNSLNQELHYVRKSLQDSEQQRRNYGDKLDMLQKELAQAMGLASKFQEKTERLEQELSNCSRKTNESCNQYKQKVEELEIKAHASKKSEELATNELHKIRDKYVKSEHLYEKTKLRCDELEKEISSLRHQKDMLQECFQKQKTRAENLEANRKSLQESIAHLTENENTLKKKLELQQKSLKSHYQQQLENVVAQKLKEFQEQLDKTEETLKSEARERERLIAERAVKQLELINEKNELELNLLQEKHNEEVELYRIQLANASKKIDDMEMKLNVYKSKRADIAEKLHIVMETQWQKALEILTSPHNLTQTTHNETESETPSPDTNDTHNKAIYHTNANKENEYETPKSSKKENNLNVVHHHETSPRDKLQAYIELLLSKSPTDFDKLDKILSLTTKAKEAKDKLEKAAKRHCHSKPPWKA